MSNQPDSNTPPTHTTNNTPTPQTNTPPTPQTEGNITTDDAAADPPLPEGLPAAYAREGETRSKTWERLRREARAVGMTRKASIAYATREADRLYPPEQPPDTPLRWGGSNENPNSQVVAPQGDPISKAQSTALLSPQSGVTGLGDIPDNWPDLPPNASLQAEVSWVQANRLRVVEGDTVILSRALSPAPSHAALSWLETAILFPSKWADVTVKATQTQEHEQEQVRREKMRIDEIRDLLAEMLEPGDLDD
jgi:hypothetical protein